MEFPQLLRIRVFEERSGLGVAGLALKIVLFAKEKNNYTIPLVTGASGKAELSIEHVRQSIKDDWELFPMDYISPLEDCLPDVEIRVCSADDVNRTVEAMKKFSSASTISNQLIEAFEHAVNSWYVPKTQRFNIEQNRYIAIGVASISHGHS